jgi:hypothetical protein
MRLGQHKPSTDPDPVIENPPRAVRVQRSKHTTFIKASCEVGGAVCFVRTGASGQISSLVRIFKLVPAEPFGDGIVVFGLSGSTLERLRNDHALSKAVAALLKAGARLSLQKNKLVASVGNAKAAKSKEALSFYVGSAATRMEKLIGFSANEATGVDRLKLPYIVYSSVSALIFGTCLGVLESSLKPLTIAGYSLAIGCVLAGAAIVVVIPAHLRKHALGGAAAVSAVVSAIIGSTLLGSSVAMIGNTYVGEKFLSAQEVLVEGTIVLKRGKHTNCWLYPDHSSSGFAQAVSFERLPLKCSEVHYHDDPTPRLYDVELNPGLLGAPFVQSIRAVDAAHVERFQ